MSPLYRRTRQYLFFQVFGMIFICSANVQGSFLSHQCRMILVAVLAILLQPCLLLEGFHSRFRLAAEVTIHRQRCAELVQKLLLGLHIRTSRALLQKAASKGVRDGFGRLCGRRVPVVDERQLSPVLPGAFLYHGLHTAVVEPAPFDSISMIKDYISPSPLSS